MDGKPSRWTGVHSTFPIATSAHARGSLTTILWTPSGPWRAPFSNTHAFVSQCFINELAEAGGRDHVELLIEMMGEPRWLEPKTFRAMNTEQPLELLSWRRRRRLGQGNACRSWSRYRVLFLSCRACCGTSRVSGRPGKVTVHKVTAAVDVGPIINRSGALNQVQVQSLMATAPWLGKKSPWKAGAYKTI